MKLELPEQKKLVFTTRLPIRWGDMDAMGHVNNIIYFQYMESARLDWFTSIGVPTDPQGQGPLVVNAFCSFFKQLEYPGDVVLKLYASDPGRSSFETWLTMERADQPGTLHAAGGATTVWVDYPRQKSAPMPDWLRELVS